LDDMAKPIGWMTWLNQLVAQFGSQSDYVNEGIQTLPQTSPPVDQLYRMPK